MVTLGTVATRAVRPGAGPIADLRGSVELIELGGVRVQHLALYHPAAALYTRALLDELREDFSRLAELLARPAAGVGPG